MQHKQNTRWLLAHYRAIQTALQELMREPFTNILTIFILGIAITLPLLLSVTLKNIQHINRAWHIGIPSISLYLKPGTQESSVDTLIHTLQNNKAIQSVSYITPDDAIQDFQKNTGLGDMLTLFKNNPLPGLLILYPNKANQTPAAMNTLFATLKTLPLVDTAQLDLNWVTRLHTLLQMGQRLTTLLSLLFAAGIALIVANTLRTQLARHQAEIDILRLVGATDAYIRRPFLYRGALYGLLGGLMGWFAVTLIILLLRTPAATLAQSYQAAHFALQGAVLPLGMITLLLAGLLGFIGAFVVVDRYLRAN